MKKKKDPKPSSKMKLIEGEVPRYRGDVEVDLDADVTEPVVVLVQSGPGLGKTHFGFTFPNVACCDTEMKGEKVWRKFYRGEACAYRIGSDGIEEYEWDTKTITPSESRLSHASDWGEVAAFYDKYSKDDWCRTLMFDSESDLREYAETWTLKETGRASLYGGDDGSKKVNYALCFGKLKYILFHAKRLGKNLVYTAKLKPKYVNDKATGEMIHDGYSKQMFYTGYAIELQLGVYNSNLELLYPKHIFGKVLKCENMRPDEYPPYLIECNYRGVINELVRGTPWKGSDDDFIREVIKPRMDEMGVQR